MRDEKRGHPRSNEEVGVRLELEGCQPPMKTYLRVIFKGYNISMFRSTQVVLSLYNLNPFPTSHVPVAHPPHTHFSYLSLKASFSPLPTTCAQPPSHSLHIGGYLRLQVIPIKLTSCTASSHFSSPLNHLYCHFSPTLSHFSPLVLSITLQSLTHASFICYSKSFNKTK